MSERRCHDLQGRGGQDADDSFGLHAGKAARLLAEDLAVLVNEHDGELVRLQIDADGVAAFPPGWDLPGRRQRGVLAGAAIGTPVVRPRHRGLSGLRLRQSVTRGGLFKGFGEPGFPGAATPFPCLGGKFLSLVGMTLQALPQAPHLKELPEPVGGLVVAVLGSTAEVTFRRIEILLAQRLVAAPVVLLVTVDQLGEVVDPLCLQGIVVEAADGRAQPLPSRLYIDLRFPERFPEPF